MGEWFHPTELIDYPSINHVVPAINQGSDPTSWPYAIGNLFSYADDRLSKTEEGYLRWFENPRGNEMASFCFGPEKTGLTVDQLRYRVNSPGWTDRMRPMGFRPMHLIYRAVSSVLWYDPYDFCDHQSRLIEVHHQHVYQFLRQHGLVMQITNLGGVSHATTVTGWDGEFIIRDSYYDETAAQDTIGFSNSSRFFGLVPKSTPVSIGMPETTRIYQAEMDAVSNAIQPVYTHLVQSSVAVTVFIVLIAWKLFGTTRLLVGSCAVCLVYGVEFSSILLVFPSLALTYVAYLVWRSSGQFVRVSSDNHSVDVNAAKDYFKQLNGLRIPMSTVGEHRCLAWQRREAERASFELLRQIGHVKVRDVGGSRSRFPELAGIKHICAAQNHNADILRDEKSPDCPFENCRMPGQFCPKRTTIPAAIISHVDYYMQPAELLACVSGPTIVINHDFDSIIATKNVVRGTKEYRIGAFDVVKGDNEIPHQEATFTRSALGVIQMSAADGTPYTHAYNKWTSEGEIVAGGKAAVYTRLTRFLDTSIYLLLPAAGTYDASSSTVLVRSDAGECDSFHFGNQRVSVTDCELGTHYVYTSGVEVGRVPRSVINCAAQQMLYSPRDHKFMPTLNSLVVSSLRAERKDLVALSDIAVAHVTHRVGQLAIRAVQMSFDSGFDPAMHGLADLMSARITDWAKHCLPWVIQDWLQQPLQNHVVLKICRVVGIVHRVAPYEVFVDTQICEMRGVKKSYRFRGGPEAIDGGVDRRAKCSAAQIDKQCDGVGADPGHQSRAIDEPDFKRNIGGIPPAECAPQPSTSSWDGQDQGDIVGSSAGQSSCRIYDDGLVDIPEVSRRSESGDVPPEKRSKGVKTQTCDVFPTDSAFLFSSIEAATNEDRQAGVPLECVSRQGPGMAYEVQVDCPGPGGSQHVAVPMRREVSKLQLSFAMFLLSSLPSIPRSLLECAVRWSLYRSGVQLSPCGHCHNTVNCFDVRVYALPPGVACPQGYQALGLPGMGVAIPCDPTITIRTGAGGLTTISGPDVEGYGSKMFLKTGNEYKDDRPPQHLPEVGRVSEFCRPIHQLVGARFGKSKRAAYNARKRAAARGAQQVDHAKVH